MLQETAVHAGEIEIFTTEIIERCGTGHVFEFDVFEDTQRHCWITVEEQQLGGEKKKG